MIARDVRDSGKATGSVVAATSLSARHEIVAITSTNGDILV